MAGFYHFLERPLADVIRDRKLNPDTLREHGLDAVLADCRDVPDHAVVTECVGPSGTPGACIYPKTLDSPPGWGYRQEHQEWIQAGNRWLGWERQSPPRPEDLLRRDPITDYRVLDPAGREWRVPCARSSDGSQSSFPVEYVFSESGVVVNKVPATLEHLWTLSGEIADHYTGRRPRDESWQVEAALVVLQTNYRLGKAEVTALQTMGLPVLTRGTVNGILLSLVDNDLQQEFTEQKKSETPENPSAS